MIYAGTRLAQAEFNLDNKAESFSVIHAPTADDLKESSDPISSVSWENSELNDDQKQQLLDRLRKYPSVISRDQNDLGSTDLMTHRIPTGDHPPIAQKSHSLPPPMRPVVTKLLKDMQGSGAIEPSTSPWSSPIVLVKKKSGDIRFCVDFRKLNKITKRDMYPLPKISDLLDSLGKAKFVTCLDLVSGYWQIPVHPADREKTAFVSFASLFQFCVMPFGLSNAGATFQRTMELALAGLQWNHCLPYLDDIIIYSETFDQHLNDIESVLQRFGKHKFKIKLKKCHFCQKQIKFLGHIVSAEGIRPDPDKIRVVQDYILPKSVKEVKQFLGLASYYRKFVQGFAMIATPLHQLLKRQHDQQCINECQKAFDTLINKLVNYPILAYPDFT